MSDFNEMDYLEMKKNEIKIFRAKDHGKEVDKIMQKDFARIRNFPYNSYDDIQKWQLKRISEIVDYAYENIPLYHKKYSKIGYKKGMIKTWEDFKKLPLLYKEELIEGFPNEIAKNVEDFNLSTRSSGSSGKFVTLSLSLDAIYTDTIQGVRQFMLQSGDNYKPDDITLFIYTLPWWIRNIDGKYKQDFLPTTSSVEEVIKKLEEIHPKIISTYPTYLTKMVPYGIDLKKYGVELVIVHSEQSTRQSRDMLEKALNVKVLDEYSSEELTRIALECPEHIYHLEEDACYIEIVDPKTKENKNYGERGVVVGTNLLNMSTPIIRYYQGDLAEMEKPVKCKCGNNCRILKNINGRYMDSIITEDDKIIPASAFMDIAYNWFSTLRIPIHGLRYQFVQHEKGALELYLIKGKYEIDIQKIRESLYTLIPEDMKLEIKFVSELPETGQKYRPVISFVKEGKYIMNMNDVLKCTNIEKRDLDNAKLLVEDKIKKLRDCTPNVKFEHNKLAEVEINKFFYNKETVDRVMIVLRANGCEHYKQDGGCSMCSHFNGTDRNAKITTEEYIEQWKNVINGTELNCNNFDLNNYPVVCVYNLGSFLNENEISKDAVSHIFKSLNSYTGIKKVIIESRAEYVKDEGLQKISEIYKKGVLEVGIGVESTNKIVREICHHKGIDDLSVIKNAVDLLHKYQFKALAYINFKPIFLTEQEAINDAIKTAIDCFNMGFDAVSIEPTSLQNYSLANHLYQIGQYRVPWLWSIRDVVQGIYNEMGNQNLDIRLGGYFDEEVLSGSQGVGYEEKNEIFPHMTSWNCDQCSNEFINCIKKFNMTYDINELYNIKKCDKCYKIWEDVKKIRDSRNIIKRVNDILGNV